MKRRVTGRALQLCGLVLMVLAILPVATQLSPAYAQAIAQALAPVSSASPTATASPTPTAKPKPKVRVGGPLIFTLAGAISFGETSTASAFGGGGLFNPSPSPSASASPGPFPFQQSTQNNTVAGVGLSAALARRTATTLTQLTIPIGLNPSGRSSITLGQLLYSTPKYSAGYGAQSLDALGQLQLGTTLRGFIFIVPVQSGQATFYQGPAIGVDSDQARLYGALVQELRRGVLYEGGFVYGVGANTGIAKTLIFGAATVRGHVGITGEGAWQSIADGVGDPHGIAGQVRFDESSLKGGCDETVRSVPDQFVAFGTGEVFSDKYGDFSCHSTHVPITLDVNVEKSGDGVVGVSQQRVASIGFTPTFKFGGVSLNVVRQDGSSSGQALSSTDISAQFQTQIFHTLALVGAQQSRTISSGVPSATQAVLANLSKTFGKLVVGVSGQVQKQTQQGTAPNPDPSMTPLPGGVLTGLQKGFAFNVSRAWRKTTVQAGETITHTISSTSLALQRTPLINITRQISPVISITTSLGYQTLTDPLNPASNGRSRVFSFSLSAPFSYGNGIVTGRADPRLPATIVGRIVVAAPNASAAGAPAMNFGNFIGTGGVGNVQVTLDGKYVQRTDLSGGFQFSFVPPGQHSIVIDTSSIPRGFTVSTPSQTLDVQGGQQAQVAFTVGTFGGVLGHVYGTDTNGNPLPLANVKLRVDDGLYSQTDATGAFGFGGLSPGEHEITVIPNTVPAFADFAPEALKAKVAVTNGQYASLDFRATPLGSISGAIVYGNEMAPDDVGGISNAYVVAEPGEHAAIDEDDGSFVIDDLPPGDYTISPDPETVPDGLGASPDSVVVHLGPGEHYKGVLFLVGRFEKKVVFSLIGGGQPVAPPSVRLSEGRLPPRGSTVVSINAPATATGVAVTAFEKRTPLVFDKGAGKWVGELVVPADAKPGSYAVAAQAGASAPASATLTVDPKLPIAILQYTPRNAGAGQSVNVRARFLVNVHEGSKIEWEDGTETVLGKPISGRVFTFSKRLTLLPLHGLLLTTQGSLPIELL